MKIFATSCLFLIIVGTSPSQRKSVSFERGVSLSVSSAGWETAKFLTVDPELYFVWRDSLPESEALKPLTDPESQPPGTIIPAVERILFGAVGGAWRQIVHIPCDSEDEHEAFFRSVFLVNILYQIDKLFEGDVLSKIARENLLALGRSTSYDPPSIFVDLVSSYLLVNS